MPTQVKARFFLYEKRPVVAAQVFEEKSAHKAVKSARTYFVRWTDSSSTAPGLQPGGMLVTEYSLYHHAINVGLLALCFARFLGNGQAEVPDHGPAGLTTTWQGGDRQGGAPQARPATAAEWEVMPPIPHLPPQPGHLAQFPADGLEVVHQHTRAWTAPAIRRAMGERINPGARLRRSCDC